MTGATITSKPLIGPVFDPILGWYQRHLRTSTREGAAGRGAVMSVPLEGGEMTTLATDQGTSSGPAELILANLSLPGALALDATDLYVATHVGEIFSVGDDGQRSRSDCVRRQRVRSRDERHEPLPDDRQGDPRRHAALSSLRID
jgi:hypothetical protein